MPQMIKLQNSGTVVILDFISYVEFTKNSAGEIIKAKVCFLGGGQLTVTGEEAQAIDKIFSPQPQQILVPQISIASRQ